MLKYVYIKYFTLNIKKKKHVWHDLAEYEEQNANAVMIQIHDPQT